MSVRERGWRERMKERWEHRHEQPLQGINQTKAGFDEKTGLEQKTNKRFDKKCHFFVCFRRIELIILLNILL